MTELLIIKTAEAEKIKSLLAEKKLDYQRFFDDEKRVKLTDKIVIKPC